MRLKLPFQRRIFQDLLTEQDGLVITSPGLGVTSILSEFVHLYATKRYATVQPTSDGTAEVIHVNGLVFLVNADWEVFEPYLAGRTRTVKVNNATTAIERQELYRQGGVIAITSRILVVDLLCNRVPIPLVTGFLVADAHQVSPNSVEAFILRIFRLQNKSGFIKAFSDRPDLFVAGFAPLERTLKLLFLRTAQLWPRFQVEVAENLDSSPIHVVEVHQTLTKKMQLIQASIMDCLNDCLAELRRSKLLMEVEEELTLENGLGRNFDRMLRTQLESVWHRIGFRTREVIADVATLRQLLTYLTSYDCVSFLVYLDTIIALNSTKAKGANPVMQAQPSAWLMTDAANTLIKAARARVFIKDGTKTSPVLEEQPKWPLIAQLLDEVREADANAKVLVTALTPRACRQIRNYLAAQKTPGEPHPLLRSLYQSYWRSQQEVRIVPAPQPQPLARRPPPSKRRRVRGGGNADSDHQTTLSSWANVVTVEEAPSEPPADEEEELTTFDPAQFTQYFGLVRAPEILVHSITGDLDDLLLSNFAPSHVIMVDPDPAMVRRIEAYQAATKNTVTVYFLVYSDSVEEQRFLAEVRREKDGFERLINEKAKLVIPVDHGLLRPSFNLDSRTAGGQICQPVKVVIDVREFRAALPSALHAAGLEVIPVTLQIGDYILTPELCIERKSIPDLIQSINSGRLYSQCEAMFQFYSTPILLIEFDENKTFSLEAMGDQWSEFVLADIPRKLVLLSLAFPRLKIIWSSSPAQSAQIFLDLKNGLNEPDVDTCVRLGSTEEDALDQATNSGPVALLRGLPGINSSNYRHVMRSVDSIKDLTGKTLPELQTILKDPTNGQILYNFFNGVGPK